MDELGGEHTELYFKQDMADVLLRQLTSGRIAVASARCPGKPTPNEDSAAVIRVDVNSLVLVVADGAGGYNGGEIASEIAVRAVEDSIRNAENGTELRAAIIDSFEKANKEVIDLGIGAATTLAVAEIQDGTVRTYHAGDSTIFIVGQRGKLKLQTVAHSPVGYAVESGVLDEKQAMYHEERHLISNMIGSDEMRIEIGSPFELSARDTLLLASDGIFDNVHSTEVVDIVRKGGLEDAARTLLATASGRMLKENGSHPSKPDDVTFLMFRLEAKREVLLRCQPQ